MDRDLENLKGQIISLVHPRKIILILTITVYSMREILQDHFLVFLYIVIAFHRKNKVYVRDQHRKPKHQENMRRNFV